MNPVNQDTFQPDYRRERCILCNNPRAEAAVALHGARSGTQLRKCTDCRGVYKTQNRIVAAIKDLNPVVLETLTSIVRNRIGVTPKSDDDGYEVTASDISLAKEVAWSRERPSISDGDTPSQAEETEVQKVGKEAGAEAKQNVFFARSLVDEIAHHPDELIVRARAATEVVAALIQKYERKNSDEAQSAVAVLQEFEEAVLAFIESVSKDPAQPKDAAKVSAEFGERMLVALDRWWRVPVGSAVLKSAMGVAIVGVLTAFGLSIPGSFAFGVIAAGVYGERAIGQIAQTIREWSSQG